MGRYFRLKDANVFVFSVGLPLSCGGLIMLHVGKKGLSWFALQVQIFYFQLSEIVILWTVELKLVNQKCDCHVLIDQIIKIRSQGLFYFCSVLCGITIGYLNMELNIRIWFVANFEL